jgi:trigger factor
VVAQENLTLSDDEVENGLKEMSENFGHPLADIKKYYDENKDKLDLFKHTLLEKKAINLIIESSKIEDVEPEAETESEADAKK